MDKNGRIFAISDDFARVFGSQKKEVLGSNFFNFLIPQSKHEIKEKFGKWIFRNKEDPVAFNFTIIVNDKVKLIKELEEEAKT